MKYIKLIRLFFAYVTFQKINQYKIKTICLFLTWMVSSFINAYSMPSLNHHPEDRKKMIYKYLVEPFLQLDTFFQEKNIQITHCTIIPSDTSKSQKSYAGIGSCIYHQLPLTMGEEEENQTKQIIIHAMVNQTPFKTILEWKNFSLSSLFRSYWDESIEHLQTTIYLKPYQSTKDLSLLFSLWMDATTAQKYLNIREVNLQIQPTPFIKNAQPVATVSIQFIESLVENKIYELRFSTNYYIGAEEFFIQSIDPVSSNYLTPTNNSGQVDFFNLKDSPSRGKSR